MKPSTLEMADGRRKGFWPRFRDICFIVLAGFGALFLGLLFLHFLFGQERGEIPGTPPANVTDLRSFFAWEPEPVSAFVE